MNYEVIFLYDAIPSYSRLNVLKFVYSYLESEAFDRFLSVVVHPFGASTLRLSSDDELSSSNFRFLSHVPTNADAFSS